ILGLRAMYFMLAGAVDKFHMLRYGLAVVLIFVGLKMVWLNAWYGGKFPITLSLGIIASVIAASIVLSLLFPKGGRPRANRGGTGGVSPTPGRAPGGDDRRGTSDRACDHERGGMRPMGEPKKALAADPAAMRLRC
ncbi:MAG TPA: hypothetical protein VLT62_00005, partial [Candidatus Methylomirabilis sp.]|nr:hypothetical protein [Candidatus Methylomirabilis sp.]